MESEINPSLMAAAGISAAGLTVRMVGDDDAPKLAAWWRSRHGTDIPAAILPPLGVMIEDRQGPAGALFCYESYGVGVAFIEWPLSRPGLGLRAARQVFTFALQCIMNLAGQCCEPRGSYGVFRVRCSAGIARFLYGLGFQHDGDNSESLIYLKT